MDSMQIKTVVAGVFFGIWPLFMNKSGLSGNASAMAFSLMVLIFVFPFAVSDIGNVSGIKWTMLLGAGACAAIGVLCFNNMLASATAQNIGSLLVLNFVLQIAVAAVYQIVLSHGVSLTKGIGFVLAAVAAVLLLKS